VKLLDFGIAKLLDATALQGEGEMTIAPFTPDYAAPEQLIGEAVTTGTDVYALGLLLFERSGRAVAPTRAGELYYEECIAVLQRLEAARQRVADQRLNGVIRIGLMPSFTRALLPPVLDRFLAAAPAAQISVIEAYSGVLTEMVRRGELDFAGVPAFAGADGIVHRPLLRDRETLVRARQRGRKARPSVRLSELGPLKVVVPGVQSER
jgi:DNA-binding transcriptional LysR family regulator